LSTDDEPNNDEGSDFEASYVFFAALFEPDDRVEIRAFHDDGRARQFWFTAADKVAAQRILLAAKMLNEDGFGIFCGANPRWRDGGKAEDVALFRVLFADFDGITSLDEVLARIAEVGLPEPSVMVFSGGGWHVYWILTCPFADAGKWTAAQQRLAVALKSDASVVDAPRLMRVPGFINTKPKYPHRPRVQLHEVNRQRRYELSAFLPEHCALAPASAGKKLNHLGEVAAGNDVLLMTIPKDSRHMALYRFACMTVFRTVGFDRPHVIAEMQAIVWALSQTNCAPKKDLHERKDIDRAVLSAVKYRHKVEAERGAPPPMDTPENAASTVEKFAAWTENGEEANAPEVTGYQCHGLERKVFSGPPKYEEWLPGEWVAETVESDPPELRLIVPAWRNTPCGGVVVLSTPDFLSPTRVAERVFDATLRVMLAAKPQEWARIWSGWELRDPETKRVVASVTGLRAKLIQNSRRVVVGESAKRYAELAAALLGSISRATPLEDSDRQDPDEGGRPTWVTKEHVWFRWSRVKEDVERTQKVERREWADVRRRLCAALSVQDLQHERFVFRGRRLSYVVFDRRWTDALQSLADGSDGQTETKEHACVPREQTEKISVNASM
jgi:hypothetical protein